MDFTNIDTLKTLYTSLVRSKLEYNFVIWCPYLKNQIQLLEGVQNQFLSFMSFKCNIYRETRTSYQPLLNIFNVNSLSDKTKTKDLKFLFKIINGNITCPDLLCLLHFNVPQCNTKLTKLFYIYPQKTNYSY